MQTYFTVKYVSGDAASGPKTTMLLPATSVSVAQTEDKFALTIHLDEKTTNFTSGEFFIMNAAGKTIDQYRFR
jgi:hypothetical protein